MFLKLVKHTIDDIPPADQQLLMLVDVEGSEHLIWQVGRWDPQWGWHCDFNEVGFTVVNWYQLPLSLKAKEEDKENSQHMRRMEDFWYNR